MYILYIEKYSFICIEAHFLFKEVMILIIIDFKHTAADLVEKIIIRIIWKIFMIINARYWLVCRLVRLLVV